jgi:hypothetical protein
MELPRPASEGSFQFGCRSRSRRAKDGVQVVGRRKVNISGDHLRWKHT